MLGYGLLTYGLIAAGALEDIDTPDWTLNTLVVDPEHRGKGYGSLLLRSIEGRALSLGAVTLRALAPLFDDRVVRFYGQQGYTLMPDSGSKFKKVLGM